MDDQVIKFLEEELSASQDELNSFPEATKKAFEDSLSDQILITRKEFEDGASEVFADLIPADISLPEMSKAVIALSHIGVALSKKFFGEVKKHD